MLQTVSEYICCAAYVSQLQSKQSMYCAFPLLVRFLKEKKVQKERKLS